MIDYENPNYSAKKLSKSLHFKKKWTRGRSYSYEKNKWFKLPTLVIGCYDKQRLIGFCTGSKRKGLDSVILNSIAVKTKYQRHGWGSKILHFFENEAKKLGERKVSVGSAGGYVERFFLKNGFYPHSFFVRIRRNKVPKNYKEKGFTIIGERGNKYVKILFIEIKNKEYNPKNKDFIKEEYNAYEVGCIFEKILPFNHEHKLSYLHIRL